MASKVILAVVGVLVLLEVLLRVLFGFGNPLTYIADEQIGYLLAPNQRTRRFGNRIEINEYSMRSSPITVTRSPFTLRVLLLGDSIANGCWWTDQEQTIAAIMTQMLQQEAAIVNTFNSVEVLNASASSWGPRNELAYLQRFGTFDAQAVVLLINTDDLFATAPTSVLVGRDRNYPSHKPLLALVEAAFRYTLPNKPVPELLAVQAEPGDRVGRNLAAIKQIQDITFQTNSYLLLVMTPLLREVGEPGPRNYEHQARQRLTDFTQTQQIDYLDFLPVFNSVEQLATLYRDHIHLRSQGNQLVSEAIKRALASAVAASDVKRLTATLIKPSQLDD